MTKSGVVPFLLLSVLFSAGCFQSEQPTQSAFRSRDLGPNALWPLQNGTQQAPSVHILSAEALTFSNESPGPSPELLESGVLYGAYSQYPAGSRPSLLGAPQTYSIGRSSRFSGNPFRSSLLNLPAANAANGKSFGALFASLFRKGSEEADVLADALGDESRNPFREASRKAESGGETPASKGDSSQSTANQEPSTQTEAPKPSLPTPASAPAELRYVFLGDFDGSGHVKFMAANRIDNTAFSFSDARRVFNLQVNPSAVEEQRSLTIDDINGDGLVDLLVTSSVALAGAIQLGDGNGGFYLSDKFLTGYEPTVATLGLPVNGVRDIASLNARTGVVTVFRGGRQLKAQSLGFIPDYIGHLVSNQDGFDYFMAATQGGYPQGIYRFLDDGSLESTSQTLPADPNTFFRKDFLSQNLVNVVQVYQIGSYVSVTLSNGRGQSFNVANMKVSPNVFLAIGDVLGRGTLDVAVAILASSTPTK